MTTKKLSNPTAKIDIVELNMPVLEQLPRLQLSLEETANALGLPLSTLELICRRGQGPVFFTVGRRKFTTRELVLEWQQEMITRARAEIAA